MPDQLGYYIKKLKQLRVGRSRVGPAPHKPLLLLAVIDLLEQGEIQTNRIVPSPQLVETYLRYWNQISTGPPRPFLPFNYLKSSGFWHLHAHKGQEAVLASTHAFSTMSHLAGVVAYVSLDDELFALLLNPETREVIRQAIIETYFPNQRPIVEAVTNENRAISNFEQALLHQAEKRLAAIEVPESPTRSAAFRGIIMKLYDYTCAACRLRVITINGKSAVDAAHIIPFAETHDDGIGNGLALCKLHHWAFDNGVLSLDDNYTLLVSAAFDEKGPTALLLRNLKAKHILLPSQKPFLPALHAMRWHRENKFMQ